MRTRIWACRQPSWRYSQQVCRRTKANTPITIRRSSGRWEKSPKPKKPSPKSSSTGMSSRSDSWSGPRFWVNRTNAKIWSLSWIPSTIMSNQSSTSSSLRPCTLTISCWRILLSTLRSLPWTKIWLSVSSRWKTQSSLKRKKPNTSLTTRFYAILLRRKRRENRLRISWWSTWMTTSIRRK